MSDATWTVKQGDRLERVVEFTKAAHDWTGTTARGDVKLSYDGDVQVALTLTPSYPETGTMSVLVVLTGAQTAALSTGTYRLDFVLERVSPAFGPYTPVEVSLVVADRVTI